MTPRYLICSSYFAPKGSHALPWFYRVWHDNTFRFSSPETVIVIASGGCKEPKTVWDWKNRKKRNVQWIQLKGDIGHCDHLLKADKPSYMPACCAGWLAVAWMAYMNECDMVVKEQDALWFGDMIGGMYSEIGERKVILGTSAMQGAASSVFLVKWDYIPQFCQDYVAEGPQNIINRISETNLFRLCARKPEQYAQFSFKCGKDRPLHIDKVFYLEKPKPDEMKVLESHGLISCKGMPDCEVFSNHA